MFRWALCLAILLPLTLALPRDLSAQDAKVQKQMEAAQASFDKGRYEDALEKFQRANQVAGGSSVPAILGALEASLALGRYDGIILQISGASSDLPQEQTEIDSLVGRAHLLYSYVVEPTAAAAKREALAKAHRERAAERLAKAIGGEGEWAVRSAYYLAEARAALGDSAGAAEALERFFTAGGEDEHEATSARSLQGCLEEGRWVPEVETSEVPSRTEGSLPRRAADGASILSAVMTSEGTLDCMRILPPLSERADEAIYETLSDWRYSPAENAAGEAISVPYTVPLDFTND